MTVYAHSLGPDPFSETAARMLGKQPRKRLVEAQTGVSLGHPEQQRSSRLG